MLKLILFIFFILIPPYAVSSSNLKTLKKIYKDYPFTFFCTQAFNEKGELLNDPGGKKKKVKSMPIMLPQQFAQHLLCYNEKICIDKKGIRYKGLRCCQVQDPLYRRMMGDLHNLVLEDPTLKAARKNFRFAEGNPSDKDACYFHIDRTQKIISPDPAIRGIIARTYFYMRDTYRLILSEADTALMMRWNREYPPSVWEIEREQKIKMHSSCHSHSPLTAL